MIFDCPTEVNSNVTSVTTPTVPFYGCGGNVNHFSGIKPFSSHSIKVSDYTSTQFYFSFPTFVRLNRKKVKRKSMTRN